MKSFAVLGLGFGDEGKGLVTDWLCSLHPEALVVRFNGGHQAGHTVQLGDTRHVFSNFGSGALRGNPTYWSKFCTIDPSAIVAEYKLLKKFKPLLLIDKQCPVTTELEKLLNQNCKETRAHGTCGVGFGATIKREEELHFHLVAEDLLYPSIWKHKLTCLEDLYKLNDAPETDITGFLELMSLGVIQLVDGLPDTYSTVVFEGAQGLMLDQRHGFFPHVTRSNTGLTNVMQLVDETPEVFGVTRSYLTRHGNGPLPFEDNQLIDDRTNIPNEYQGTLRTAPFNIDLIEYAVARHRLALDNVVITWSWADESAAEQAQSRFPDTKLYVSSDPCRVVEY